MANENQTPKKQEDIWREVLYSSDNESIIQLLGVLRDKGNNEILPDILKLYNGYKGTKIGTIIYEFLIDLKDKEAVPVIMKFIKDKEFLSIKRDLLTLCWQTGLDFSDYLSDFTDIFIKCDLKTSFEAFTAIEYIENAERQTIKDNIKKLQISIDDVVVGNRELLVDLVNVLRTKI